MVELFNAPFERDVNIFYHKSNPIYRDSILNDGLIPSIGNSYRLKYPKYMFAITPVVFMFYDIDNPYDSTYDDDLWEIDLTTNRPLLYIDAGWSGGSGVVSFDPIKPNQLTLKVVGTGESIF